MLVVRNSYCWLTAMTLTALLIFPGVSSLAQSAANPTGMAPAPAPAAANEGSQASCTPIADAEIPLSTTIQAKVTGLVSAGHLKPGKELWVKVARGVIFPGCTMETDSAIYGQVTAASSSKNPNASELSLLFDHVDCAGRGKQAMKLFLIGVVAPPDDSKRMHDATPTEVRGGTRQIDEAVWGTNGLDAKLNPGGPPHTVHPGIVVGMRNLKLEPQGGPGCSAKMSSTDRNIELAPETILLLAVRTGQ
jgi:hypothetical protein